MKKLPIEMIRADIPTARAPSIEVILSVMVSRNLRRVPKSVFVSSVCVSSSLSSLSIVVSSSLLSSSVSVVLGLMVGVGVGGVGIMVFVEV